MLRETLFCSVSGLILAAGCLTVFPGCSGKTPSVVLPEIVAALPHDSSGFVQGLFYDNGVLYESLGLYGSSALRALDARSGALIKNVPLDPRYFGEGCAKMDGTIVQITWREQTALTWSLPEGLSAGPTLVYGGEGWGLTSDGKDFYMSNGSDTLYVRNNNFAIMMKIPVTSGGSPVKKLNELEWVKGRIFANVWYSDSVLEINPKNGKVERIVDCSELIKKEQPNSSESVLNGIAYDPGTKTFYLTGKRWKKIFVVKIPAVD
jgi:glutaminyl-peptide cyclotransferase